MAHVLPVARVHLVNAAHARLFTGLHGTGFTLGRVYDVGHGGSLPEKLQGDLQVLKGHPGQ